MGCFVPTYEERLHGYYDWLTQTGDGVVKEVKKIPADLKTGTEVVFGEVWISAEDKARSMGNYVLDVLWYIVNEIKKRLWALMGAHRWEVIAVVAVVLLVWVVYRALSGCAERLFCE